MRAQLPCGVGEGPGEFWITPHPLSWTALFFVNRPKDVEGCPAAPEEFSFTAFLALILSVDLIVCVCVCESVTGGACRFWRTIAERACV